MLQTVNIHRLDQVVRLAAGIVYLILYFASRSVWDWLWLVGSLYLLITGGMASDPVYTLVGRSTRRRVRVGG